MLIYEGQILVTAIFVYSPEEEEVDLVGEAVYKLAIEYGSLKAFEDRKISDREVTHRIEFHDSRASALALANLNNSAFEVSSLLSTGYLQKANLRRLTP